MSDLPSDMENSDMGEDFSPVPVGRVRLPNRRPSANVKVEWVTPSSSHVFYVTVGYDPRNARISEVFYSDGMKSGADLRSMAQDACILVSILLQYGLTPEQIGKSLAVAPVMGEDRPASLVGAVVEAIRTSQGEVE